MGCDDFFKKAKLEKNGYKRKRTKRNVKPRILIVCEGERTEPNYFRCFLGANIKVEGFGMNTDTLVKKAIELKEKEEEPFDQIWCVFDRDDFPSRNFNKAFQLAKNNGINIAYSNEAFELWYLLHMNYLDAGISRGAYITKLNQIMVKDSLQYQKNSKFMYAYLLEHQGKAIKHARKLNSPYSPSDPEKDKPSTTVVDLVVELNKWIK